VREVLTDVHDPCCREKGISVVEMGLLRSASRSADGGVRVELLLTSGWCPFAGRVLTDVRDRVASLPGVTSADVEVVWDEAWTMDRLSPRARGLLRFLPDPVRVPDPHAYVHDRLEGQR
jgi:metal-sulfur cluster biosynthetic enzyme